MLRALKGFSPMRLDNPSLVLDLVEGVAQSPRPYDDVMDTWRTSCPRLTIWEDALDNGLVARIPGTACQVMVCATARGFALLADRRGYVKPAPRPSITPGTGLSAA